MADEKLMVTLDEVQAMRERLGRIILPWQESANSPSNYIRRTGLGEVVVKVDRWLSGYVKANDPQAIGWKVEVQIGSRVYGDRGLVPVHVYGEGNVDAAMAHAKAKADAALQEALYDAPGKWEVMEGDVDGLPSDYAMRQVLVNPVESSLNIC